MPMPSLYPDPFTITFVNFGLVRSSALNFLGIILWCNGLRFGFKFSFCLGFGFSFCYGFGFSFSLGFGFGICYGFGFSIYFCFDFDFSCLFRSVVGSRLFNRRKIKAVKG